METGDLQQGLLTDVTSVRMGSELARPHVMGELVLAVYDVTDFRESAGHVKILVEEADIEAGTPEESYVYAYAEKDEDNNLLLLSSPLTIDIDDGTFILVEPEVIEKWCQVILDDEEEATVARLHYNLVNQVEDGIRDEDEYEDVLVQMQGSELVVTDFPGKPGYVDGTAIDPGTLPDPEMPTEPPATSPELSVSGTAESLIATTTGVEASTLLEYHISTLSGFIPDNTTLFIETRSNIVPITSLANGTPLDLNLTYYLRVIAKNVVGAAPASPEVEGTLDPDKVTSLALAQAAIGFILSGRISVGAAYWDANEGLVFPQPDGGIIRFPVDGTSAAEITAHLIARSLEVEDNAKFYGTTELSGLIKLISGISNPSRQVTLSYTWDQIRVKDQSGNNWNGNFSGLTEHHLGTHWMTVASIASGLVIVQIDKTTGATTQTPITGSGTSGFTPEGFMNLTPGSDAYYMMGTDSNRSNQRYVYLLNSSGVKSGEFPISGNFATSPVLSRAPSPSAAILVGWVTSSNNINVRRYGILGNLMSTDNYGTKPSGAANLRAFIEDPADLAQPRIWFTFDGFAERKVFCYNASTQAAIPLTNFLCAGNAVPRPGGLWFEDGRFYTLSSTGELWKYSTIPDGATIDVGYTWYDSVSPTHETALGSSPKVNWPWPARTKLVVNIPAAAPQVDASGTDIANQIRIYAKPSAGPTYSLQTTLAVGVREAQFDSLASGTGTPPTSNGFIGVGITPGTISSEDVRQDGKPKFSANGFGSGRFDGLIPPGTIVAWAGATAPAEWSLCDGGFLNTGVQPDLFSLIQYTYGGSGSSFAKPDLRRRFPMGAYSAIADSVLGQNEGSAVGDRNPQHNHTIPGQDPDPSPNAAGQGSANSPRITHYNGHAHGGVTGNAHQLSSTNPNRNFPYLAINYIIKL